MYNRLECNMPEDQDFPVVGYTYFVPRKEHPVNILILTLSSFMSTYYSQIYIIFKNIKSPKSQKWLPGNLALPKPTIIMLYFF